MELLRRAVPKQIRQNPKLPAGSIHLICGDMPSDFRTATRSPISWGSFFLIVLALALVPLLIRADDAAQPDRASVLPELQKTGGKDWVVTTIPEGYLMTYQHPVIFYSSNGATPTPAQLASVKTNQLCIKIIFGRSATAADLAKAQNPYSERQEAPMEDSVKAKMAKDHFYMVSPSTWANGPKYAVFIASTTPKENSIYPSTASDAVDQVLYDLANLFHFEGA